MTEIDWPTFLEQHDLHFTKLPTSWKDAPHFGNAMLASMLYMKDDRFIIEVFRADVCDHRDETYGWTAYSRPHLCIGWFTLETAGVPTECSLRQDLWNAELTGTITTDKGTLSIRHFVHAEDMAIVTELTTSGDEPHPSWTWHPYPAKTSRPGYPTNDEERTRFAEKYGSHYACNSRSGRFYIDTAGIWYQPSPWAYTTHDWNTQSSHWGVYAANRLDQGAEVVNRLHAAQATLAANVLPEEWQEDSAFLHLSTVADMRGSRRSDMRYYDCIGCLPWLLHNAWRQYRFSMDETILRDTIYPLLKRSINLYFHCMWEDDDVRLHLQPTYSPETGVVDDANFDLALCKWGCHILLKASERLGIDDPLIPRWLEAIEKLIEFPVDERGFMLGSKETGPHNHRHLSHLMMIYPLFLVNIDQPNVAELLHTSYAEAHDPTGGAGGEPPNNVAMVQTHAGPMAAAIGDGDRAMTGLRNIQAELEPNGLWGCGGNPCIESTLGLATIIQDMLLQSWSDPALDEPGPIRVFPALPSEWQDEAIEFHDLRTEGAFLVSARRDSGVTQWTRIKSLAGEPCRIKTDMKAPVCRINGKDTSLTQEKDGLFTLHLKKGDEAILHYCMNASPEITEKRMSK